jgi:anti-sigma B factor antagonist
VAASRKNQLEMTMKIHTREIGNVTILEPKGKIMIGAGDVQLREAIEESLGRGANNLLLDLKGVSKMDSSGIGELISSHHTVTEHGGSLKVMNMPSKLFSVFDATQIVTVLDVFDNETEALASFR